MRISIVKHRDGRGYRQYSIYVDVIHHISPCAISCDYYTLGGGFINAYIEGQKDPIFWGCYTNVKASPKYDIVLTWGE